MAKSFLIILIVFDVVNTNGQSPCIKDSVYRQFDFWIGEWDVYGKDGKKKGDSKIELILDSCVILENWKSLNEFNGVHYAGRSFNTYNSLTKQWQQTWVDNTGGTIEFLEGHYENDKMVFQTRPFPFNKDTMAIRRLTFFRLPDHVRQFAEISKNNGRSWEVEYDLDYRRKKM